MQLFADQQAVYSDCKDLAFFASFGFFWIPRYTLNPRCFPFFSTRVFRVRCTFMFGASALAYTKDGAKLIQKLTSEAEEHLAEILSLVVCAAASASQKSTKSDPQL